MVGDDQCVRVEHCALKTRVGAHVQAYLFAHETGVAVGGKAVEQDPEGFPGSEARAKQLVDEHVYGGEIGDEGKAGPERESYPCRVLQ